MALTGLLLLSGCAQSSSSGERVSGDVASRGYVSGDGTTTILAADERPAAPELVGETLEGQPFALSALRGSVVVLNVWASWCAPCRDEAPDLQKAFEQLAEDEVQFVGLNIRDSVPAAQAFVRKFEITYPNVSDPDGTLLLGFAGTLPPSAIPSTLVIDRDGRVAARAVGPVDRSRLLGLVEPVLG